MINRKGAGSDLLWDNINYVFATGSCVLLSAD